MRFVFLLLLLASTAPAQDVTITPFLELELETACPGDILHVNAVLSNGTPAEDVELRLVRHVPFQGLRGLKHTDEDGYAFFELTRTGEYRIYIEQSEDYNSERYAEFNYSEKCPPPPPKPLNITVEPDCNSSIMVVYATSGGQPLGNVFIKTKNWSTLTESGGKAVFPLQEGLVYLKANRSGYADFEEYIAIDCTPPECLSDKDCAFNQHCFNESCVNLTGTCGYPENHSWIDYGCCNDSDCDSGFECRNNACVELPPPAINASNKTPENITENKTGVPEDEPQEEVCVVAALPLVLIIISRSGLSV
ncbi:hypothetical protein GF318_04380 [Candidatus Micrarchaeota archaeon]|nr:hypothetical protein [Candidatus Micrarchaeota archaeon]